MSTTSCTPVVVDGWGGAGDGCLITADALGAMRVVADRVRACYPEYWRSSAADRFGERLDTLLLHCARLGELVETAHHLMAAQAAAVAEARRDP